MASSLECIIGKNVFIFDTETTGLPERVPGAMWGSANEYWPYTMNEKYNKSRIVSCAWSYYNSFSKLTLLENPIKHYIRCPEGFDEIPTSHIHGITYDIAVSKGVPFNDIFENNGLYDALIASEYIIAHNIFFDIYILLNELYRLKTEHATQTILHIKSLMALNRCICTGNLSKDICKLEFNNYKYNTNNKKKAKIYKMPKLSELYKHYYKTDIENAHTADGDVKTLMLCLLKMIDT